MAFWQLLGSLHPTIVLTILFSFTIIYLQDSNPGASGMDVLTLPLNPHLLPM